MHKAHQQGFRLPDHVERDRAVDEADISRVVVGILASMTGDLTAREAALLHEIGSLGAAVQSARREISALKVGDISGKFIPSATDELDAIVSHTSTATETILEACETLDAVAERLEPAMRVEIRTSTMRIFEACSFQDITGQRISKVIGTLKAIESAVQQINRKFQDAAPDDEAGPEDSDTGLLNGPQLPSEAMAQAEIDRLLASFD